MLGPPRHCASTLTLRSQLHESLNAVRDLQDDIRAHDEQQARLTESTRNWLLYFTLIEAAVLVGVTAWQNLCTRHTAARTPHARRTRAARAPHVPTIGAALYGEVRRTERRAEPLTYTAFVGTRRSQVLFRGQAGRVRAACCYGPGASFLSSWYVSSNALSPRAARSRTPYTVESVDGCPPPESARECPRTSRSPPRSGPAADRGRAAAGAPACSFLVDIQSVHTGCSG